MHVNMQQLATETYQKNFTMLAMITGNKIPFTEFKYLHAIKSYGNL